jgi:hypothetical protein
VLAAAVCILTGCDDTPKERLEGRWIGERVDSFHPAQAPRAAGWATGLSFTFKGSRVTVAIPAESPRRGTYKIAQATKDELRLRFLRPTGAADEATFRFEGEDQLRWMLGDGRSIVLRKEVVD